MNRQKKSGLFTLHVDGCAGNGKNGSSAGAVLSNPAGERVWWGSRSYKKQSTSCPSEYRAMKFGLDAAARAGARNVSVKSDCKSVVDQMRGAARVQSSNVKGLHTAVRNTASSFSRVQYEHVPRAQNREANKLARQARKK